MPDYNKMLEEVQKKCSKMEKDLKDLLVLYDGLYRESNHDFTEEKIRTGSLDGLMDFYRLVNSLRRNRDVVSSMVRATKGFRSLKEFRFVVEDLEKGKLDEESLSNMQIPVESGPVDPVSNESAPAGEVNA